jgi:hypothetical protein
MVCFEVLRSVLDDLYQHVPGNSDDEKTANVLEEIRQLTDLYLNHLSDESTPPIDYSSSLTQYAYLYMNVACHANIVCDQLNIPTLGLSDVFDTDYIKVCCLGGGPGSELLGIMKYLERMRKSCGLNCVLADRVGEWADAWEDIHPCIRGHHNLTVTPRLIDVQNPATWRTNRQLHTANLYCMVYFASELFRFRDEVEPFFQHLFANVDPGTKFLYIDNRWSTCSTWITRLAGTQGVELLGQRDYRTQMPFDEWADDLGDHYRRLGDPRRLGNDARTPRIQASVSVRTFEKQ